MTIERAPVDAVLGQVRTGRVAPMQAGAGTVAGDVAEARIETPMLQLVLTRLWDEEQDEVREVAEPERGVAEMASGLEGRVGRDREEVAELVVRLERTES